MTQAKEQKEKILKKNEQRMRDLLDDSRYTNTHATGAPEGEEADEAKNYPKK